MTLAKTLSLAFVVLCVGFALTACESVPFVNAKDQIESLVTIYAAGKYTVNVVKDGKILYTETWTCTQADGKMTGCHREAPTVPVSAVK